MLRRKRMVLLMCVLGSVAGLTISCFTPKVYYARTLVQITPDPLVGCFPGKLPKPRTLMQRVFRRIDSAATRVGLPTPNLEQRLSTDDE